jgi:RNA polymerase primary sigma factor
MTSPPDSGLRPRRLPTATQAPDDVFAGYLRDIAAYGRISRDEEKALSERIQRGDLEARNTLVMANVRLAITIAKNWRRPGVSDEDLIQEANRGLLRAAEKFKSAFDVPFSGYAQWWIERYILEFLAQKGGLTKLPLQRADIFARVQKARGKLFQVLEREPTLREVAQCLRLPESLVTLALQHHADPMDLDARTGSDGEEAGPRLAERIGDRQAISPDEAAEANDLKQLVETHLALLPERTRLVLCHYFGLRKYPARTLDDIAERMGLTRERVRQLKEQGLKTLNASGKFADFRRR